MASQSGFVRETGVLPYQMVSWLGFVRQTALWRTNRSSDRRLSPSGSLQFKSLCSRHSNSSLAIPESPPKQQFNQTQGFAREPKNLLVEEYPEAAPAVSYIGEGRWVFDSDVYSLAGLGRFYIGLASEITILDAPGLKEYVEDYKKKYL